MSARRVLLANEPRLIRTMLKRIFENTPGLEIVGEVLDQAELASIVGQTSAEWVVATLDANGEAPEAIETLFAHYPHLCVLMLSEDSSQVRLKRSGHSDKTLDGLSLAELIGILRENPLKAKQQSNPNSGERRGLWR
jgi:chemotaxis response regulator CheB